MVGLTGSFGTGKTTVAGIFRSCGAIVIDADRIARSALKKGSGIHRRVLAAFGGSVLDARKDIDRRLLAKRVFRDRGLLNELCSIVHPFVIAKIKARISALSGRKVVIIDAPLLLEAGLADIVDKLVVVSAARSNQIKRCMAKFKMAKGDILDRIRSQMPLKQKMEQADFVIYNNGTKEETKRKVIKVWRGLWR